jgi:hypothetical protein
MSDPALQTELVNLQRKLSKRSNEPGFAANCAAIEARIVEIEALLHDGEDPRGVQVPMGQDG